MSQSKNEIRNMTKKDVIEYAIFLTDEYNDMKKALAEKFLKIESKIETQNTVNDLLKKEVERVNKRLEDTERASINNSQYARNRQIELWNLPTWTTDDEPNFKEEASKLLSHTGVMVTAADIDVCHKLKKDGSLIMEFKSRTKRDEILRARKNLKHKKEELKRDNCEKMSIVKSICPEFKKMDYICRRLKADGIILETWFWNRRLYITTTDNAKSTTVSHINDLYGKFGLEVVDGYLRPSE